jgi:probable F420-dependent oxidoreductase
MNGTKLTISVQLAPSHGDMPAYRKAWMEAEALGADRIYVSDHFHAQIITEEVFDHAAPPPPVFGGKNFEATTIQAAMAATTSRVEIGCLVHANSYRNPNLMADIARTIDHLSGGRFILGMGSGYLEVDYQEYGYELGTAKSRMQDLARDMPVILQRFDKLIPPPLRKIPILIAAMGEKLGMPIAAKHADIWHLYGEVDKLTHKIGVMQELCDDIGRNFNDIQVSTSYLPHAVKTGDPDIYADLGITEIGTTIMGPDWDLAPLKELLQWRNNRLAKG